jgi:ribonuclease HI
MEVCHGSRRKLSFSPGRYTTAFQAEVYAIKACTVENLNRNYKNRNICILSDSQAAIEALGKHQITSKLVWDCPQSLIQLAKRNRVQLIWVPGHEGIVGNEMADHLARTGSEHRSQDLNQLAASQLELPRKRSGTGCTEISLFKISSLGQYFLEPNDYYDAPINRVLYFIQSVGLIEG